MDYDQACEILEIDQEHPDMDLVKKHYRQLALLYHPDKNNSPDAKEKFQEIQQAYHFLLENDRDILFENEDFDIMQNYDNIRKGTYAWFLYSFLFNIFQQDDNKIIIRNIIEKILSMCEENAIDLLRKLDKPLLFKTYDFIKKYYKVLHIHENFMEKISKIIQERIVEDECIILKPSLEDLFSDNLYKLTVRGSVYIIPLWHNELIYDNSGNDIYIKCEPELPNNISIDENNNIKISLDINFMELWNKEFYTFYMGGKDFQIPIHKLKLCSEQTFVLYKKGISKINTFDIYDVTNKSDIIIDLNITI